MKTMLRWAITCSLAALAATPAPAEAASQPPSTRAPAEAAFGTRLDGFIRKLRASPDAVPGTVVVAVHGDKTVFEKAYGYRDLGARAPMTLDTPVYNASVTKAYTGLLAALLDAEGTLPLSATIKDVWPDITLPAPLDAQKIQISKLLSHSGGIRAGGLNFRSVWTGQVRMTDVPAHLAKFATPQKPGFTYDNLGPFVWSAMAHAKTGIEWRDLLRRRILDPLGLRRTSARLEDFAAGEVARCHPRVGGRWGPGVLKPTPVLNAAGGMYASARDEATFLKAFLTYGRSANGAVPPDILRRTWQKVSPQDNTMWGLHRDGYGLGWDLGSIGGYRFVSRSGGYPGCRAISMFFPAQKFGVVVMSNGDAAANSYNATILAQAIDSWANPVNAAIRAPSRIAALHKVMAEAVRAANVPDPRLAKAKAVDPHVRVAAIGAYRSDRLGDMRIVEQSGELVVIAGVSSAPLRYLGGNSFLLLADFGTQIDSFELVRDGSGAITAFKWDDDVYRRVGFGINRSAADLSVPFELHKNRIYVPAYVNGNGPYRFLFDNGASGFGRADVSLVSELGLPKTGTADNSDGVNTRKIDVVRVEKLRLANHERGPVELWSRDYNGNATGDDRISGILGAEFFADGTLTIDYPGRVLRFSRARRLDRNDPAVIAYTGAFTMPIQIGSLTVQAGLDTGSTLPLHLSVNRIEPMKKEPLKPAGTARRANTRFNLYRTTLLEPVRIGGIEFATLEVMASREAPDDEVNVGGAVLRDAIVEIDQVSKLIAIRPSGDRQQ